MELCTLEPLKQMYNVHRQQQTISHWLHGLVPTLMMVSSVGFHIASKRFMCLARNLTGRRGL